jgi:hypothetical protein
MICIPPNFIQVNKSRRMRWAGHVACMGERRDAYRVLVGKPEGKRFLGRLTHRHEYDIKMYLKEVWWVGMDWIELAQNRAWLWALVNAVMDLKVSQNVGNLLSS